MLHARVLCLFAVVLMLVPTNVGACGQDDVAIANYLLSDQDFGEIVIGVSHVQGRDLVIDYTILNEGLIYEDLPEGKWVLLGASQIMQVMPERVTLADGRHGSMAEILEVSPVESVVSRKTLRMVHNHSGGLIRPGSTYKVSCRRFPKTTVSGSFQGRNIRG